ncbi:MAG: hypothetical protein JO120_07595 [Solirubrobacterales bacterium]|nr:hypothetical protein [Solirubrobacterales bacterium]
MQDMQRRSSRIYVTATLLIAGVVAGAAIAQAIREHSWEPIWSVAWLPAVLVVTLRGSANTRECLPRLRRRARS